MRTSQMVRTVERFADTHIVCVGDVMLDYFVHGEIERISPEAPIPVVHVSREESMLGGAGNVVRNLASLGARVDFFTLTGDDTHAADVERLLNALPNCSPFIMRETGRKTSVKTRYLAKRQQVLRVDSESRTAAGEEHVLQVLARFEQALAACDVVILSDYAKGLLAETHAQRFIAAALKAGKPVVVDPKGRDFSRYRGATLVKPNLKELSEATGQPVASDAETERAARQLLSENNLEALLVTRGSAGMMLVRRDVPAETFRSAAREVYDVSGAGDTVAAVLAAALATGAALETAAEIANTAAGIVVSKAGTAVIAPEQLIQELETGRGGRRRENAVTLEDAVDQARRWQRRSLRVGFTNGCFDLLHPGHISLLRQARERCDRLIVGLNSDASVRGLKGPDRPVQNEQARACLLAALEPVDLVVIFEEATPERLIRELRPDLLVKGADYKPEEVVGADLVAGWGGELALIELVPNESTTNLVTRAGGA